jgi:hypothetical protein
MAYSKPNLKCIANEAYYSHTHTHTQKKIHTAMKGSLNNSQEDTNIMEHLLKETLNQI